MEQVFTPELLNKTKSAKSLREYSYIHIGNDSPYLLAPSSVTELQQILQQAHQAGKQTLAIGGCSNILFGNTEDMIIVADEKFPHILEVQDDLLTCSCNISIMDTIFFAQQYNLCGLEFLAGIPAHLGGTIHMNAGAFGSSISDFLQWIEIVDEAGKCHRIDAEKIDFSYRKISLNGFITKSCFRLLKDDAETIDEKIAAVIRTRQQRHPYEFPSLGSTFKNPPEQFAGLLIRDCGLAGKRIGGAQISRKHCNFILNVDQASFCDYLDLINLAQKQVKEKFHIELELENKVINK
ncbi:MAG TPA: UDP-N-acetylmuramate dehydrogenase [Candidatus Cloacimonadota bacterium]|nr:UDP-N-acetylmuramate dehydrogenase [Candidatus Cloacimonadota bacterium]